MGKYTYTASLVDEAVNILRRADQELSGTGAAVINAVNTILNARGADRLAFDFDDILDITDYARDDIATATKEILDKQQEIEEYENAPWWKKLFASIGMALLKFIEGRAKAIEYVFDLAVSLAGFIGGIFNSNFQSACKEFVETEHVDNWFTKQFINEDGFFHDINTYSVFAYNSTAANIIEFGGSLVQSIGTIATNPIGGAAALYKSFKNLMDTADTNAIVTATPIIYPKLKEIFDIETVEDPPSLREDEVPIVDDLISDPVPTTDGEDQFKDETPDEDPTDDENPTNNDNPTEEQTRKTPINKEDTTEDPTKEEIISIGSGETKPIQVLYGPPPAETPQPESQKILEGTGEGQPIQVLYGPPPTTPSNGADVIVSQDEIIKNPSQVLYGPPPSTDNSVTGTDDLIVSTKDKLIAELGDTTVHVPTSTATAAITKKTAGSFGDLLDGVGSTPVSSKPISSKDTNVEGKAVTPLASGVIAAGVAGWGTKTYMDKRGTSEEEEDDDLKAEKWDEDLDNLSVDYTDGFEKDPEADYLSPEDELAFTE